MVSASALVEPGLFAQALFRNLMDALSRPGSVVAIARAEASPGAPLSHGAASIALTLFDCDTPIWLDERLTTAGTADWIRFHTGAAITDEPKAAAFALMSDPAHAPPFATFAAGTADYPDRSTTLILQVDDLESGPALAITGPGIKGTAALRAAPLSSDFADRMQVNRALFPRGNDLFLVTDHAVAALPRSVTVLNGA